MSTAPIPLLQRLFTRHRPAPETARVNRAERLAQIAVCAHHGYFNMSYTPLMFPFVAELRID